MEESETAGPVRQRKKSSLWAGIKTVARHLGLFITLILYTGAGAMVRNCNFI